MKRIVFALTVCSAGPLLAQDYRPVAEKIDAARVARLEADAAGQNADVRSTLAETLAALDCITPSS